MAAIDMGYGHLRAALPLMDVLGAELVEVDRPPIASAEERRLWLAARRWYEGTSRMSQLPVVGAPVRWLLDTVTRIEHLPRTAISRGPIAEPARCTAWRAWAWGAGSRAG